MFLRAGFGVAGCSASIWLSSKPFRRACAESREPGDLDVKSRGRRALAPGNKIGDVEILGPESVSAGPAKATKMAYRSQYLAAASMGLWLASMPFMLPRFNRYRGATIQPSSPQQVTQMFNMLNRTKLVKSRHPWLTSKSPPAEDLYYRPIKFIDMGSGDGRLVIAAKISGYDAYGVDVNPFLVWASRRQARKVLDISRDEAKAMFKIKNMWDVDVSSYDVVAFYGIGIPSVMVRFRKKFTKELKPHSLVMSNTFLIPGWNETDKDESHGLIMYETKERA